MPIESSDKPVTFLITRTSQLTGITRTMEIPITPDQLNRVENRHVTGELVSRIVPELPSDLREFLMTGITKDEWETHFSHRD